MRTIYIIRHAKASRDPGKLSDLERGLLPEGIERANKVADILRQKNVRPGRFISSHAFRALNTAVLFALKLRYPVGKIEISRSMYGKGVPELLELIRSQNKALSSLALFGHNPELTDLYNCLCGAKLEKLPTSSVACITFESEDWANVGKGRGRSQFLEIGKKANLEE